MKRLALALLLVSTTAVAAPLVTPPAGWTDDAQMRGAAGVATIAHLGTARADGVAEAYVPPGATTPPPVVLFVNRTTATTWLGTPGDAARATVDELHASIHRDEVSGGTPQVRTWSAAADPATKQLVATLAWDDAKSQFTDEARLVIASDGKALVAVLGECFATASAAPALLAACKQALATLDTGIAPASRVALALPATAPEPPPPDHGGSGHEAPQLSDGGHVTLPPMTIAPAPPVTDRRPMYIGAGLIVLALVFWWNRKRRDRFDAEERGEPPPRERRSDPDADDLHAAARGDSEDEA